jgi:general secretion pathway protein A
VVVDEAHTIQDPSVFEELRLLLNFQWKDRFLITLILMGQPELLRMVEANKPFEQRLGMKAQLEPMTREETGQYLVHRLRVAGHAQPESVFSADAVAAIYEGTGGIPRRINRLADMALVSGMAQRSAQIDAALIKDAAVSAA